MNQTTRMAFRVLIIGGTGQVGTAVVRALTAEPSCAEVVDGQSQGDFSNV
jgi:nucleoside-diphosphate-sugar epimerase